jgi:hypothetical protein
MYYFAGESYDVCKYTNFALPQRAAGNKRKIGPSLIEANVSEHLKQASDALTTHTYYQITITEIARSTCIIWTAVSC